MDYAPSVDGDQAQVKKEETPDKEVESQLDEKIQVLIASWSLFIFLPKGFCSLYQFGLVTDNAAGAYIIGLYFSHCRIWWN